MDRRLVTPYTWAGPIDNSESIRYQSVGTGALVETGRNLVLNPAPPGGAPSSWSLNRPELGDLSSEAGVAKYQATAPNGETQGVVARTLVNPSGFYAARAMVRAAGALVGRLAQAYIYDGEIIARASFTYTSEWQEILLPSTEYTERSNTGKHLYIYISGQSGTEVLEVKRPIISRVSGIGKDPGPYYDGNTPRHLT